MGNPHRGEVSFEAAGKTWTLRYAINELIRLECHLEKTIVQIATEIADPTKGGLKMVRTVFWMGLLGQHEDLTEDQAGDLMAELGVQRTNEVVGKAFELAFPAEGKASEARPPRRARA